jgi:hypothetical protein
MDAIHLIKDLTGKKAQLGHKPRHPAEGKVVKVWK